MSLRDRLRLRKSAGTPSAVTAALDAAGMSASSAFSPGTPISPYHGYSTRPRAFDYPVGVNLNTRPREAYGRPSFATLRALIDAYDIARICINHKIDGWRSMDVMFTPADGVSGDVTEAITAARVALEYPDRVTPFDAWLAKWGEGFWRYDAACLYRRRDRAGRVIGLEVVDGTTITPWIDDHGRVPEPPAPAYGQYVKGLPWEWLTTDDLIYTPFRPQPDSPYGLSPMEAVILNANIDLRFQRHFLNYFTAGSMPAGFMRAPADVTTPDQVGEWQDYWDALMIGDQDALRQVKVVPHDSRFEAVRDPQFDENFPLYLLRRTCAAFGVVPQDLGIVADVNRANGETQVDVQYRVNDRPAQRFLAGILTRYVQRDLGLPVKVSFDDGQEKEDRLAEARAWQVYVQTGAASVDEMREELLGLPTDNERPVPRFIFSPRTGPVPLTSVYAIAGRINPLTAGPSDDVPLTLAPFDGAEGVLPDKQPGGTQFRRAPINPDEPEFPALERPVPGSDVVGTKPGGPTIGEPVVKEATAGVTSATGLAGLDLPGAEEDERDVVKAAELAAYRRFTRRPRTREFVWEHHSPDEVTRIVKAGGSDPKAGG